MRPCKSLNVYFDFEFKQDIVEQMHRVLDAGFTHIDMNFWDYCHDERSPFMQEDWRGWLNRIREGAERLGGTFTQAHAHVYNFYEFGADSVHERQVQRSLMGAGVLGVPWIVMHPSALPEGGVCLNDNIEYFKREAELAYECGTGIAIENTKSAIRTGEGLCELVEKIGMPNVGICWDTGHAHLCGLDQHAEIRTMKGKLHALHIADNHGVTDEHTMPFMGTIDWAPLVSALSEIGYDGDFTFEAHNFVRDLPEACKADALRLMYRVGTVLSGNV